MDDDDSNIPGPSRPPKKKGKAATSAAAAKKDSGDADTSDMVMKKTTAKRRWALLSDHLSKKVRASDAKGESDFDSYNLYDLDQIGEDEAGTWYKLKWKERNEWPSIELRLIGKFRFDAMDISGFNNTGNIRIWPAEECLAYYLLENSSLINGKRVLELGGGMSGLAGVYSGFYASEVLITDGNEKSIENLNTIITHNKLEEKCHAIFHRWNEPLPGPKEFDLVVAADCFFDPNFHDSFIDTIASTLSSTGTALLFAPERSGSLRCFIEKLFQRNIFIIEQTANICEEITSKISAATASSSTDDNFDADKDHVKMLTLQKIST